MRSESEIEADFFEFEGEIREFKNKRELIISWEFIFKNKAFNSSTVCFKLESLFFLDGEFFFGDMKRKRDFEFGFGDF